MARLSLQQKIKEQLHIVLSDDKQNTRRLLINGLGRFGKSQLVYICRGHYGKKQSNETTCLYTSSCLLIYQRRHYLSMMHRTSISTISFLTHRVWTSLSRTPQRPLTPTFIFRRTHQWLRRIRYVPELMLRLQNRWWKSVPTQCRSLAAVNMPFQAP